VPCDEKAPRRLGSDLHPRDSSRAEVGCELVVLRLSPPDSASA
jgi:hypothetical protein